MATRADVLRLRIDVDEREAVRDVKKFEKQVQRSGGGIRTANQKVASSFESTRLSIARWRNAALLTTFTITATIVALDKMAKAAEKISALSAAFKTLGKRIEATPAFLGKLREATRGFISDTELMKQANTAIILGVARSEAQFTKLAAGAVKLGRAVGLEATPAIESLVTGIGRQSRLMLDNLGIIVKAEQAYENYALAIGKAASELTEEERKEAFATEAIKGMEAALQGLNDETVRLSDVWTRAATAVKNATADMARDINNLPSDPRILATLSALGKVAASILPGMPAGGVDIGRGMPSPETLLPGGPRAPELVATDRAIEAAQRRIKTLQAEILRIQTEREGIEKRVAESMKLQAEQAAQTAAEYLTLDELATRIDETFGTMDVPDVLIGDVSAPTEAIADLTVQIDEFQMIAAQSAANFGATLVHAAFESDVALHKMFANMLRNLAAAIVQAMILKAIMSSIGGPLGGAIPMAGGGIVGQDVAGPPIPAQHGLLVRGGLPGIDSVPIIAQRGEMMLPTSVSSFIMEAVRNSQRQPQSAAGTSRNASLAAPTNIHVTLNVGPGGYADGPTVRKFFEDNPEAVAAGIRRATRRGAM